jgi:SAM-dependent methyltransferase
MRLAIMSSNDRSHSGASSDPVTRFQRDYMKLRDREGRGSGGVEELLALPYLNHGTMKRQWQVHARSYEMFSRRVVAPAALRAVGRPLDILDLGAGNGWLSHRLQQQGHDCIATDLRIDTVDGLGAGAAYEPFEDQMFRRVAVTFDSLPFPDRRFDLAIFASSLHYASDLQATFDEVSRVLRSGGRLAVLDSPFYQDSADGDAMVTERERATHEYLGDLAEGLLALGSIEFLTQELLEGASVRSGISWRRHRVWYPLWYELRPIKAWLRRKRPPSRFDLWEGRLP